MIRFDGNTFLICDSDKLYGTQLAEVLGKHGAICFFASSVMQSQSLMQKHEFDLVICNYYLADGLIHNLIDWASEHLETLPVFTCFSYPLPGDMALIKKQFIAATFSKSDPAGLLAGIPNLLFDFQEFHENLLEMETISGISLEIQVGNRTYHADALELMSESIFFHSDEKLVNGMIGVMKISLTFDSKKHQFLIAGTHENSVFKVSKSYLPNWNCFLNYLNNRQINITSFMKKAAGF